MFRLSGQHVSGRHILSFALIAAFGLSACESASEVAGSAGPPLTVGSTPDTPRQTASTDDSSASADLGGGELFGALLGAVAVVGLAAAGASGDAGQAALAAAAASSDDPTGAAIVSAIQTGTAPMAAANSAAAYPGSGGELFGGANGSCDEALRRVDQQLADANPRITNNIERMEATMWALMAQLEILRGQCPNAEPYASMIQQHDASLTATISACNGTTTKAGCVAQLPTGQPSLASQAYSEGMSDGGSSDSGGGGGGCVNYERADKKVCVAQ